MGTDIQEAVQRGRAYQGVLAVAVEVSIMGGHNKLFELSAGE